jgi:hypothetical protein
MEGFQRFSEQFATTDLVDHPTEPIAAPAPVQEPTPVLHLSMVDGKPIISASPRPDSIPLFAKDNGTVLTHVQQMIQSKTIEAMSDMRTIANDSTNAALSYVLLAFSLTAALAWNDFVRGQMSVVRGLLHLPRGWMYDFGWAILATILAVFVYVIFKHVFDREVTALPIMGVVA